MREDVSRHKQITIEYLDEDFKPQTLTLDGLAARIVQHEYDHIEGILFTDKLSAFKKTAYQKQAQQYYEREGEGRLQNEIFKY